MNHYPKDHTSYYQRMNKKYLLTLLCCSSALLSTQSLSATAYTVTNTNDTGANSLRQALIDASSTGGAGSTITFMAGVTGTITLGSPLPPVSSNLISISSNSNAITINGQNLYQAFFVESGSTLALGNDITLLNTASIGGSGGNGGSNGGGGALGAGGGLFVAGGSSVTLQGLGFSGCFARGGNGGTSSSTTQQSGGGGGGMNGGIGGTTVSAVSGGGGGGYAGAGGSTNGAGGGGGGGGLLFNGGSSPATVDLGGGGGASNAAAGSNSNDLVGGNGANGLTGGDVGGTGGAAGVNGGSGTGNGGGGGGGGQFPFTGDGGSGGNSVMGAGGGGTASAGHGGNGGTSTGSFGGGGGGGGGCGTNMAGSGGNGGSYGGGGGGATFAGCGGSNGGSNGGNGGALGGGGGGAGDGIFSSTGGNGGFGGGGGGGYTNGSSGQGGFAAGSGGGSRSAGGGGAALGGSIFIGAAGTLTIQDPFATSISSGSSSGGSGAHAGQALGPDLFMASSSSVVFDLSTAFTINTNIESDNGAGGGSTTTGGITKSNTGTLTLGGTNNYTGVTTLNAGTLQISSNNNLGATANSVALNGGTLEMTAAITSARSIALGGAAAIQTDAGTSTLSGQITGSGPLTKTGAGTLFPSNSSNSYTGGTAINAGILQINSDGNLGNAASTLTFNGGTLDISGVALSTRPIAINTTGRIQVEQDTFGILAGSIAGAGSLTTAGAGVLFLSGANTYAGTTTAESGTLIISSTGSISSAMAMTIQIATVRVDGTVTSPITVDFGGTLQGTGTVGDVIINGIIEPGDSIGTIHGANFTFNSGSSYNLELNDTTSDLIDATTSVTINGGTLRLFPTGFSAPQVTSYTIITAPTVTTNTPFVLVNPLTRYSFTVQYDPTDVLLVLSQVIPFHVIVPSGNAGAVARCFEVLAAEGLSDIVPVVQVLDLLTPSQMAHAFNQMQPANFNNIAFSEENVAERVRQIYTNHFFDQRVISCPEDSPWRLWIAPFVERVRQHGNSSVPGYSENFYGATLAADYRFEKHWMVTSGFSYANTHMNVPHGRTRAEFKSYAGTVGAAWTDTAWFADALFSYLYSPVHAQRKINFGISNFALSAEVDRKARHREYSNQVLGHLGSGYDFKIKTSSVSTVNIYPFANIDYFYLPEGGYTEHGAQSLDLKVYSKRYDLLRPEGGLGIGYKGCFESSEAMFDISVSYVREFRFLGKKTRSKFKAAPCNFTVTGLNPENNLVCPSARLRIAAPLSGFSLTLGYHGEYGAHFSMSAGEAELRKAF